MECCCLLNYVLQLDRRVCAGGFVRVDEATAGCTAATCIRDAAEALKNRVNPLFMLLRAWVLRVQATC